MTEIKKNILMPWRGVIICEELPKEEMTESGVILAPSNAHDPGKKPDRGIVIAVGEPDDPKKPLPYKLEPGDIVFYERYTKNEMTYQGKAYNLLYEKHIMAVIKK